MKNLIEELYDRNVVLCNDSKEYQKKLLELWGLAERHDKELSELLGDKGKEIFEKFKDCYSEALNMEQRDRYVSGFMLGGRLVAEILFRTTDAELQT